MNLTIVQPDLAGGTMELQKIIWNRNAVKVRRSLGTLVFFGCLFIVIAVLRPEHYEINAAGKIIPFSSWGFPENAACVFLGLAAFYLYARSIQKRKYNSRIKEMADRMRAGTNVCTFTLTETGLKYVSDEYETGIKWTLLRSYFTDGNWVIMEFDYSVFGIDTRLITEEQKKELAAFLSAKVRSKNGMANVQ